MEHHILVINGAPRKGGNTDILTEMLVQGAASAGVESEVVELRQKKIGDCAGCYQCSRAADCSLADDMAEMRLAIEKSSLLVLAGPLYWWGVPGLMKTFLDRLFFYYQPRNRHLLAGKGAVIFTPLNQQTLHARLLRTRDSMRGSLPVLNLNFTECIFSADWGPGSL